MLRRLHVTNLALIEGLELELSHGFTCLTGETGAGKSLLLDAVGLLLGQRATSDLVRSGADKAVVEGLFDKGESPELAAYLDELGIGTPDRELVIVREVQATGKTVARINGRLVTVQALRDVGVWLVRQHGQHDSTTLLRKETHLGFLDRAGGDRIESALGAYVEKYAAHREAVRLLAETEKSAQDRLARLDLLAFQIQEIEAAKLRPGEDAQLARIRDRLRHAEKLHAVADAVYAQIYEGGDRRVGMLGELHHFLGELDSLVAFDEELGELREYLETARVHLEEAASFARRYRDAIDFDPGKLERLETRLDALGMLFRKYGQGTGQVLAFLAGAKDERDKLTRHEEFLEECREQSRSTEVAVLQAGEALRAVRRETASFLERELENELVGLRMAEVAIAVRLQPKAPGPDGMDDVEFLFSANRGEELRPLVRIASGGELSRLMLAFARVLTERDPVSTMIFDEIDAGISGLAAQSVAQRMQMIARTHQVLCVTHLPQMASRADRHLLIEKSVLGARMITTVRALTQDERVEELAKMTTGVAVTEAARQQAQEMLASKADGFHG